MLAAQVGCSGRYDGLVAVLGPAGIGAFATALVQRLRTRRADVEVSRPDGTSMKVSAKHVQALTGVAVSPLRLADRMTIAG
ncbi:effector-associated constant component EACC1 [Dactylosporangium sp. CA-152071]|uniref:effector-associated constant component EACC1 n=1 Tax=Dactylosporangium sp. CA-152071 TaxID=3239933 RepID=UPI003D94EA81